MTPPISSNNQSANPIPHSIESILSTAKKSQPNDPIKKINKMSISFLIDQTEQKPLRTDNSSTNLDEKIYTRRTTKKKSILSEPSEPKYQHIYFTKEEHDLIGKLVDLEYDWDEIAKVVTAHSANSIRLYWTRKQKKILRVSYQPRKEYTKNCFTSFKYKNKAGPILL